MEGKNKQIPAGYKDSPLGIIPVEWEVKRLGEMCTKIGSGVTPKGGETVYSEQGHFFIRSQNVGWGQLLLDDVAYIDDEIHKKQIATELKYKDVLLNITGASIGRSVTVSDNIVGGNVNQHVCIIRPKSILDSDFLCFFLISSQGQKMIDSYQAGGNRQGLNFEQIRSFVISLPPLPEQQRIAEVLGAWDQGIELQAKLVESLQKRKRALMQQLLTGKKRLKGFDQAWKKVKLGEIADIKKGKALSSKDIIEGVYPVIAGGKSSPYSHISFTDEHCITISASGAYAGYVSYHDYKIWASDCSVVYAKEKKSSIAFLFQLLSFQQYFIYSLQSGGAQPHIFPKDISGINQMTPPLPEQQAIAEILTAADREIELAQKKLEVLREQKRGLMQQLLTGKKRLKV